MTNELAKNTRKQVLTLLRQGKSASLVASMLNFLTKMFWQLKNPIISSK